MHARQTSLWRPHERGLGTLENRWRRAIFDVSRDATNYWGLGEDGRVYYFFCIRCDDHAISSGQWLLGSPLSAVHCSSAACSQSLMPTSVSSGQNCWRTVCRCGQVWRMCSGVCSSEPHSQWAESARPNLFRCFHSPQWPAHRRKKLVWVLLSRVFIWSFYWSYPLFFSLHVDLCFCIKRVLTSLYEVERWSWGSFAAAFASLSAVSFLAMPTSTFTHWILSCCLTEYTGCCVAAGCKDQCGHSRETEEHTRSQKAWQYSAGCSLLQSGVLWKLTGREVLLCSWSSGHQLGWRGRKWFCLSDGCRHHCIGVSFL